MVPRTIMLIRSGILQQDGYSATLFSTNLIVEDIVMNDVRNNSELTCVVVGRDDTSTVLNRSDPITLYIAGE